MTKIGSREAHHVVNGDGHWAVYVRGHKIPLDQAQRLAEEYLAGDGSLVIAEHHFHKRRLKNCGNHDWPCEFEGEWHLHFSPLRPTADPDSLWTEIRRDGAA